MFSTNKTFTCTGKTIRIAEFNCKHWSIDKDQCKTKCDLNLTESPTAFYCIKCPSRTPYPEEIKEEKVKAPKLKEKVTSYIKAETSQITEGKVDESIFQKRKDICLSCEYLKNKDNKDSIGWCTGGCGCSVGNPRAALSEKLYMPKITCPKGKFGMENGTGFNIKDLKNSITGMASSLKDFLINGNNT